jgi:hypothetical protein
MICGRNATKQATVGNLKVPCVGFQWAIPGPYPGRHLGPEGCVRLDCVQVRLVDVRSAAELTKRVGKLVFGTERFDGASPRRQTNPILLGEPQCLLWFSGCATACPRWIPREPSVLIHSRRFGVYLTIGPSVA